MANVAVKADVNNGVTRREFLYYIWGASMALFTLESVGLLIWFLKPKFREGEFGGAITLPIDVLPEVNAEPFNFPDGRFWLVNLDDDAPNDRMYRRDDDTANLKGILAVYKVCTHLGCIYNWTSSNDRFECPCHGSKYRLDGRRIESPAPRDLDIFKLEFLAEDKETVLASASLGTINETEVYMPVELPANAAFIRVDTGDRKLGASQTLLCDFVGECP